MEYVFILLVLVAVSVYLTDRKGWNSTAKRLSTIVRANLEAGKPVAVLEPIKDQDDWSQRFKEIENPPSAALVSAKPANHVLVRTSYYHTQDYGEWPQWHCKCGAKGHEATGSYSNGMESAQRRAKRAAETHIQTALAAEEMLAKTKGTHAW